MKTTEATNKHVLWKSFRTVLITVLVLIVLNTFLMGNFEVVGPSMEGELLEGDRVLVSKLHYGARLPRTVSVPFVDHHAPLLEYLNLKLFSNPLIPYFRTVGFSELKRNDIVVFNMPTKAKEYEINEVVNKRVVALPGDTIALKNGVLYCNGKMENSKRISFAYDLVSSKRLEAEDVRTWGAFDFQNQVKEKDKSLLKNFFEYELYADEGIAAMAKEDKNVVKVQRKKIDNFADYDTYPHWLPFHWNQNSFGNIVVPKKGLILTMDSINIHRYFRVIKDLEENEQVEIRDGRLFVNNVYTPNYQFKKTYFFSVGDNRDISMDSRHFGFIPEDHVIGKVVLVYYSRDQYLGEMRWKRFFKLPE